MKRTHSNKISTQMKRSSERQIPAHPSYEGNTEIMISTGSTLLDLAISGRRKKGGGIPGGILVEIFGPNGSGKTVLLCEIAGAIQRQGGAIKFNDPEARLNKQFATLFDFDVSTLDVDEPDTVTEFITGIREWEPKNTDLENLKVNGILTDSLAALSTQLELNEKDGDKMGMRRAKEFSEGLRKVCRILKQKNHLLVCSNQIRDKANSGGYGEQFTTPGGKALPFYASIRLRVHNPEKIKKKIRVQGKELTKVIGIKVKVEVYKNSVDEPYRTADVIIQFDYGVDNIRANLQYLKDFTKNKVYAVGSTVLGVSMEDAIGKVETLNLEGKVEKAVITLWEEIDAKFRVERVKKRR